LDDRLYRQSYDVQIDLELDGLRASNTLDLKNPYFRYTGQQPQPPPGQHSTAPSDNIWTTIDPNSIHAQIPRMNGVNGVENVGLMDMAHAFSVNPSVCFSIYVIIIMKKV
jgi:histone-arginine methyltransferase CARM1